MLKLSTLIISLVIVTSTYAQTYTIAGYIEDANTGERIIGAYIVDSISQNTAQTNAYGFYSLKNVGKDAVIQAIFTGFQSDRIPVRLINDTLINLKIYKVNEIKEVKIISSRYRRGANSQLGLITIPVSSLAQIPALGETDLIKSLQNQAGIKGGIEGSAGIFVRGGNAGENLFMLDDVPLYNISHLYGFFSVFNSSAIKDIKLLTGCFPAKYGGRVSSVIDIRSRDGNTKSIKGEFSLGFVSSKFTIEGPLLSNKTTFIISGRRSYFDLFAKPLKKTGILDENFPDYYFYDLNARITHTFSEKNKIYFSYYQGKDKIQNKEAHTITTSTTENTSQNQSEIINESWDESSGWGNIISSLRWNHIFGKSFFSNTTLAYSSYNYFTQNQYKEIGSNIENNYNVNYNSDITDFIIKTDFDFAISNKHSLTFGIGNTFHTFNPGKNKYSMNNILQNVNTDTSFTNELLHANEPSLYIGDLFEISNKITLNFGARLSGFISDSTNYYNIEPRIAVNYAITPHLVFKSGYSRMVQYMHLLSSSSVSMPTDLWVPALKGLRPIESDQINTGFAYDWKDSYLLSVELYQKWLSNTTDILDGVSLIADITPWYNKTTQGNGLAKGIEVSLEKQQGKLTGSIHYTLSSSTRKYQELNNGLSFPFKFDRKHDFNISVNYRINAKWDISVMWVYGSGYRATLPVEKYNANVSIFDTNTFAGEEIAFFPSRNNYKLPDYHRLDIGLHYKTKNRIGEHNLSFDIYNAYNHHNQISAYYTYAFNYGYLLPMIPTITYTYKF
ncbi:MAG: TonB-dependent receptor plug domain-containing protein [Bacteroidales bacterium]|nr:TonB-dependent receptor plug domain-containing protein [Bacteroidales bacterium]